MKVSLRSIVAGGLVLAGVCSISSAAVTVGIDSQISNGYMNVFDLAVDGGGYRFGSGWGVPDLFASNVDGVVTLTPNTSISRDVPLTDAYWWTPAGRGNKNMFASFYAERTDIGGELVTFTGIVQSNTLVTPYTSVLFIKDFAPDYSSHTEIVVPVVAGAFSIELQTTGGGHHIQYGFETAGPNARLDEIAGLGSVVVTAVPEPAGLALVAAAVLPLTARRRRA